MKLTRGQRELVGPATPTSPQLQLLVLTNNDQVMPRCYTQLLYHFYPKPDQTSRKLLPACALKASLAQVLVLYYPLAGRLKERPDKGLDVECIDAGAVFVEATAEGRLQDLGGFQPNTDFSELMPEVDLAQPVHQLPLLLVQVTTFQCGGATLGVQFHHNVGDGFATSQFVLTWSEIALGKEVSGNPRHDRSLLQARHPPATRFPHAEYTLTAPAFPASFPPMKAKLLELDSTRVDELKHRAAEAGTSFTAFESVTGHLWRCITRARGLEAGKEIRLGLAVDGRARLSPPLPPGYAGNANFYGLAETRAGDLVEKHLAYAAHCVHEAVVRITDEYIRSSLDFVAQQKSPASVFPSFTTLWSDMAVTSWTRFPLYQVDFGLGRPDFAGIPNSGWDGLIILLPTPVGNSGINAMVGLREDHFSKFLADPEL